MKSDKPEWEQEEETVISFADDPQTNPADPAGPSVSEDPESTVVEATRDIEDEGNVDRTMVEDGAKQPSKVEEIAWLVLTKTRSVRHGEIFKLNRARIDIGSGPVDISINDRKASKTHACVKYGSDSSGGWQFVLHDLAATNGTFVNGVRVTAPVVLKDGDRIGLGDTELVFKRV